MVSIDAPQRRRMSRSPTPPPPTPGRPLLRFSARNVDPSKCPFADESVDIVLRPGSCVRLAGESGAGKTTLANYIAGLFPGNASSLRSALGIRVDTCEWDPALRPGERVGMLFQQTTLLDALTVAGNVCVALEHCPSYGSGGDADENGNAANINGAIPTSTKDPRRNRAETKRLLRAEIKRLLEAVGLDYARDGPKRPSELSGGMARRASLALQLAQHKRVIVLDEPFAGLDLATAAGVARELSRVRTERGAALLLIAHEPTVVDVVMGRSDGRALLAGEQYGEKRSATGKNGVNEEDNGSASTVVLTRRSSARDDDRQGKTFRHPSLFGKNASHRFFLKVLDYFLYSLPLILLTFLAAGMAIAMLSADILRRADVTEPVMAIVNREVRPLLKMLTGEQSVNPLYMMMINSKVRDMLNTTIPPAKAKLYAMGMANLFVLEIGPLITALLLSGRIGGSYAGEVATMQATAQNKLLLTLGIRPVVWTFVPSLLAAWIASPALTAAGTALALRVAEAVGPWYGIGDGASYRTEVCDSVFLPLRLRASERWKDLLFAGSKAAEAGATVGDGVVVGAGESLAERAAAYLDVRCAFDGDSSSFTYVDSVVEVLTHPVCFHFMKSLVFVTIIMTVAEIAARRKPDLTPRGVPGVITNSVVLGSLLVIFADWGFSQLLLKRH